MNESSVQLSMKLLALVANYCSDESYPLFRKAAEKFTLQLCESITATQSLRFFDYHYKQIYQRDFANNRKKNSVISVKILAASTRLITEIESSEKMLLSLLIADAIKNSKEQAAHVVGLHDVISETLGISESDLTRLRLFTFSNNLTLTAKEGFLIIDGLPSVFENHLFRENMTGNIVFVQAATNKEIFFRLSPGSDSLYLEGQAIEPGIPYRFPWGSTLITHKTENINYALVHQNLHIKRREKQSYIVEQLEFTNNKDSKLKKPISLSVYQGECIGITGSPGSGKSTLITSLMGLSKPSSGSITFEGHLFNLWDSSSPQWNNIGIIGAKIDHSDLTVFQYLSLQAKLINPLYNKKEISDYIHSVLKSEAGNLIPIKLHQVPLKLISSRSVRFAIQMTREIIRGSKILFADAPFERLTLAESREICGLIQFMSARGYTIFISCTRPSFDEFRIFDKLIILDKGYPIFWGTSSQVFNYFRDFEGTDGTFGNVFLADKHYNPDELLEIVERNEISINQDFTRKRSSEDWYNLFLENCQETSATIKTKKKKNEAHNVIRRKKGNTLLTKTCILFCNNLQILFLQKDKILFRFLLNALMTLFVTYLLFSIRKFVLISNENLLVFSLVLFGTVCGHWASKLVDEKNEDKELHLLLKQYTVELNLNFYLTISVLYVIQYLVLITGLWYLVEKTSNLILYSYFSLLLSIVIFLVIRLSKRKHQ